MRPTDPPAVVRLMLVVTVAMTGLAGRLPVMANPAADSTPHATPYPGGENVPSDAVSSFVVRTYRMHEKKLWKGLLQVLQQSGYPPEDVDAKQMHVRTSFVDFKALDYSEEVGEPPPIVGPTYHILQMNRVKEGKVSLEGIVTGGDKGGAVLSLRARILVHGLDQAKKIQVLADRRSSGVIESDFLRVLEDTLHLERI